MLTWSGPGLTISNPGVSSFSSIPPLSMARYFPSVSRSIPACCPEAIDRRPLHLMPHSPPEVVHDASRGPFSITTSSIVSPASKIPLRSELDADDFLILLRKKMILASLRNTFIIQRSPLNYYSAIK